MSRLALRIASLLAGTALAATSLTAHAQDTRNVTEPSFPAACSVVTAQTAIVNGAPATETLDTTRIQAALTACTTGKAVELSGSGSNYAFVTGPINIPSGVSLIVDGGVTLFASRNREDFQTGTISSSTDECGTQGPNGNGCKNLILFNNNSTNANSGIYGYGVIDGRGYATTLKAGVDTGISWWVNADSIPSGYSQNNPIIMKLSKSTNFTLYKITIRNSPMFHVGWSGTGFTAWGVKIQAPFTAHNTDGIDPVGSNVTITNSSISDGDDNVAVGASSPSANITVSNVNTYSGHGISVGSYTQGGLTNLLVTGVNMAGTGTDGNATGIRLKSSQDRGGLLQNVTYQNMCLKDMRHILQFTPFYNSNSGTLIPQFANITLQNLHFLAPSTGAYAYQVALQGHDASHISTINLNNIVFDSLTQVNTTSTPPEYETFNLAGNVYPAFLTTLMGTSVSYTGSATSNATGAYDCTAASTFPYEVGELFLSTPSATNLQSTSTVSTTGFTLNAMLQPAMATAAYTGTGGSWTGAPAMTKPVNFLEGSTVVGTGTLGANGTNSTLASLTLTGVSAGPHTYTAQYPGDANYAALSFGSVTVTVTAGTAAATTTTLAATPATATYGASTMLIATVATATGTPTGSVKFLDGSTTLATVTLSGLTATTSQVLGGGSHTLTAVYGGDANYTPSTSTASTVAISTAVPTATLTASPTSLALGATTTLTATIGRVATGSTPTGTVNFLDGATNVGSGSPDTSGVVTVTVTPGTTGTHTYTATYTGDANYGTTTSAGAAVTVSTAPSTTTLTASANGPYGTTTTLTAAVTSTGATVTPTGSVKFLDGATTLATVNLTTGSAITTAVLGGGTHMLTAVYSADTNFSASTSTVATVTITPAATTASLSASPATIALGSSSTLTITINKATGGVAPTGTVTVLEGSTTIGTGALNASGVATVTVTPTTAATHSYTATYPGDTNYASATASAVTVTASTSATTVTLTLSAATIFQGGSETFDATVASAGGTPTGTVTFLNGSTSIGTATLSNGVATLTLPENTVGMQSITASYAASGAFAAGVSGAQTLIVVSPFAIAPSSTSITLAAGANSSVQIMTTPGGGFGGIVSLSCASPVAYVSCNLSPASLTFPAGNAAAQISSLSLSVAATVAASRSPFTPASGTWVAWLLPLGALSLLGSRKLRGRALFALIGCAILAGSISGCGGGSSNNGFNANLPPPGTQQVTVTATSGSVTASTTVNVVIPN